MIEQNLIKTFEENFIKNWDMPALSDYQEGNLYTYGQLSQEIAKLHLLFDELGVKKGDKISLVGKNHSSWSIVFLATITYGGVITPILHEFNPESIEYIIDHSDSKLVFINESIWKSLRQKNITIPIFELSNFQLLNSNDATVTEKVSQLEELFYRTYASGFSREDVQYATVSNDEVVCLNYTSGTTGFSKGVMITANNFAGNISYAGKLDLLFRGDRILAFLPMAHVYGCAFDFLYALSTGVHVTLLGIAPTPHNLIKALNDVKPHLIITVPLVFEKIYKKRILPMIEKPIIKTLLKTPLIKTIICKKINQSLIKTLGGHFREVIIGGAALNAEVENLFHKIKFPFTVGYGMTECAPLISYDHHYEFVPGSCGSVLDKIMEARIDSSDPENIPGEIQVKGENVMKGYYKNPEATAAAFTADGWLKTGDQGVMRGRRIYIRGRIKTMILSGNGQNIYPEEIESKLNNLPYIAECLVVKRKNKLIALVFPDHLAMKEDNIDRGKLDIIMQQNKEILNKSIAHYEKIGDIEIMESEFEKTPKKTIKRFLYE